MSFMPISYDCLMMFDSVLESLVITMVSAPEFLILVSVGEKLVSPGLWYSVAAMVAPCGVSTRVQFVTTARPKSLLAAMNATLWKPSFFTRYGCSASASILLFDEVRKTQGLPASVIFSAVDVSTISGTS